MLRKLAGLERSQWHRGEPLLKTQERKLPEIVRYERKYEVRP
jgi:hypothetical protein